MLNQTAEYALRTAVYLAEHGGAGPVAAGELASQLDIPQNYLSKILHQLARDGLLVSQRGKTGGFRLARVPSQITLAQIVAGFDPVDARRGCLLGRPVCSDRTACQAHDRWKEFSVGYSSFFHHTTLAMLTQEQAPPPARTRRKG
ncbi:MAG: Rrf2 family transcriptional regulator [Gemmatimonadetes bacterium]|nr:Rrf2 family transcriptional regulator [Gemmatimonadota bacterium]